MSSFETDKYDQEWKAVFSYLTPVQGISPQWRHISWKMLKHSGVISGIFRGNKVNNMTVDALALCVTMPTAAKYWRYRSNEFLFSMRTDFSRLFRQLTLLEYIIQALSEEPADLPHRGQEGLWYELSCVQLVLGTICLGYELSWVRVVLGTSCLRYEWSWVRVVLGTSCSGYELS